MRGAALVFAGLLVAATIVTPNVWRADEAMSAGEVCTPTGCLTVIPTAERAYGEPTLAPPPRVATRPPRTEVIAVTIEVEQNK